MSAAHREFLIVAAREWIDTPFEWGQRQLHFGVDCIQLVVSAGMAAGLMPSDPTVGLTYPSKIALRHKKTLLKLIEPHFYQIDPAEMLPGDVGYFRTQSNMPIHFGIMTDRGIIHASWKAKKVVETRLPPELSHRLVGYYRFKVLKSE